MHPTRNAGVYNKLEGICQYSAAGREEGAAAAYLRLPGRRAETLGLFSAFVIRFKLNDPYCIERFAMHVPSTRRRVCLAAVLLLLTAFVFWNLSDEMHVLKSWSNAFIFAGYWLTVPYLLGLKYILEKEARQRRGIPLLQSIYLLGYGAYAFNGSTEGNTGAEHMHLYLVPILFAVLVCIMFLAVGVGNFASRSPKES